MDTYHYDRDNAEKAYEYQKYKRAQYSLGIACGTVAALYARPIQRNLENYNAFFRKPWMRLPIYSFAFICFYYGGIQLPGRLFPKLNPSKNDGVNHAIYTSSQDMVSKFRLFENMDSVSTRNDLTSYLSVYSTKPVTKNEMVDKIALTALQEVDISKLFRVKRQGKDKDDIFWNFGKIHGLENIAFADPQEIAATNGNPVKLQKVVNKYDGAKFQIDSYEHLIEEMQKSLNEYKAVVNRIGLNPSDRKKLLALPFYLAKRQELPEPRRGQPEFDLFTELTGRSWFDDVDVQVDNENKITEFDYENYLNPSLLKLVDTKSKDFKHLVRGLNLFTRTKHELLQDQKESFKGLMPILRGLDEEEVRILLHKIKNTNKDAEDLYSGDILNEMIYQRTEQQLAKLSEEENFNMKNRYRLQKTTIDYADKKRMPVDESKLKDVLRNQGLFKHRFNTEVGTYNREQNGTQWENGLLSYLNEAAFGEMKELIRDIGISNDTLDFVNVGDLQKKREQLFTYPSDHNFQYLMNALFTPLDMTDYEDTFVGWNEFKGGVPINNFSLLKPVQEELWPANHALMALETAESRPRLARSNIHRDILEMKAAAGEEEEEDEGLEDIEEETSGEGEEEGEDQATETEGEGAEEEEVAAEEEEWPPKPKIDHVNFEDRYFMHGENLRNKFNEIELDSFMKLLNVKPYKQWQDTSIHHYKLGTHTYEDDSQELDPHFHLLGEVERKHAERIEVEKFRQGSEVKFQLGEKQPLHYNYRF